jgi:transposase
MQSVKTLGNTECQAIFQLDILFGISYNTIYVESTRVLAGSIGRFCIVRAKHKPVFAPVPMPDSNVSVSNVGKYQYAYHIGKGYRNANGKAASHRTGIGKVDGAGMLIPNDNYFEIYHQTPKRLVIEVDSIVNFGDFFFMDRIAEGTGLSRVLRNVFGEVGDEILVVAIYLSLTGQALYRCGAWCMETLTGRSKVVTSQRCSRILESFDEQRRMDFFRAWAHARQQHEYLAYDVTSISSYSRGNDLVEYGYNRDKEKLPQVNLGMYYGEESKLPIFYCTYKGSIVDKSHLRYIMQYNDRLGIKDVCFVMDRGFFSEENVKYLAHRHRFIIGLANSLVLSKEMIIKYGAQATSSRYDIGVTGVTGLAVVDERYEFRSKIHLFHANSKIADEERIFKEKLARWEESLREGKSVKDAEDYFIITDYGEGVRSVERNHDAIDDKIRSFGYFLMMTTDMGKTPADILDVYRRKDIIEKSFDELKSDLDMKRLRVQSEDAAEGKMFIAFIGLILRTYVHNKLKDYLDANRPFSMPQVFDELRMIKAVKTKGGMLLHNPVTKRQRTILEQFGLGEDDLTTALHKFGTTNAFFDS